MNLKIIFFGISIVFSLISFKSLATNSSLILDEQEVGLTYKIQGQPYRYRKKKKSISYSLPDLSWNIGADCNGFDAGLSLDGLMNDLDSQFNRLQRDAVNAMKGFVTSLPLLLIQRMDPGLYETISNGIIKGEEIFNLSVASCESMSQKFSKNGFGALVDESTYFEFSSSLISDPEKDSTDIVKTMNKKGEEKGESGLPKLGGGKCGDRKNNPCRPVDDVVKAGVDIAFKESFSEKVKKGERKNWIQNTFKDADDAEEWIKETLGTVEYGTCKKCVQFSSVAGKGVYDDIAKESLKLSDKINKIVDKNKIPSRDDLLAISVNDMFIDENIVYALRDEKIHRQIFISRISDDLALMKIVDKLLAARRILIVGKSDPKFQSVSMNQKIIDERLKLISEEISILKEELELKKAARGDVLVKLLDRFKLRRSVDVPKESDRFNKEVMENLKRVTGRGK